MITETDEDHNNEGLLEGFISNILWIAIGCFKEYELFYRGAQRCFAVEAKSESPTRG